MCWRKMRKNENSLIIVALLMVFEFLMGGLGNSENL